MAMRLSSPLLVPSFSFLFTLSGCNALLGNDEGTNTSASPGTTEKKNDTSGTDDTSSSNSQTQGTTKKDGGTSQGRTDDSKVPCASCEPTLVASPGGLESKSFHVTSTHVYWATSNGAYRVALSAAPCKKAECIEKINTGQFGQVSVAANDQKIYWSTIQDFGSVDLTTSKAVTNDAKAIKPSGSRMILVGDKVYYAQLGYSIGSQVTLVSGSADGLASGTGGVAPVSEQNVGISTFNASTSYVAWGTEADRLYVRPTGKTANEIPLPKSATGSHLTAVTVHDGYVYVAPYHGGLHRAPIDGSEEATLLEDIPGVAEITVNAGGIYVGYADVANGYDGAVWWRPLDETKKGHPEAKALVTVGDGAIVGMQVNDTELYYAVYNSRSGDGLSIWKIAFDK